MHKAILAVLKLNQSASKNDCKGLYKFGILKVLIKPFITV